MIRRRVCYVFSACLAVSACATPARRQLEADDAAARAAGAATMACQTDLAERPEFADVAAKLPIAAADPTPAQIIDATKPTPDESAALSRLLDALAQCRDADLRPLASISVDTVAAVQRRFDADTSVVLRLVAREITWGQANRELQRIRSANLTQLAAIDAQIRGDLDAQDEEEWTNWIVGVLFYPFQVIIDADVGGPDHPRFQEVY